MSSGDVVAFPPSQKLVDIQVDSNVCLKTDSDAEADLFPSFPRSAKHLVSLTHTLLCMWTVRSSSLDNVYVFAPIHTFSFTFMGSSECTWRSSSLLISRVKKNDVPMNVYGRMRSTVVVAGNYVFPRCLCVSTSAFLCANFTSHLHPDNCEKNGKMMIKHSRSQLHSAAPAIESARLPPLLKIASSQCCVSSCFSTAAPWASESQLHSTCRRSRQCSTNALHSSCYCSDKFNLHVERDTDGKKNCSKSFFFCFACRAVYRVRRSLSSCVHNRGKSQPCSFRRRHSMRHTIDTTLSFCRYLL